MKKIWYARLPKGHDLKGNDGRARGNALGNIKKAIHCRIDQIINSTHLVFANDWDWFTINTKEKLKIIKTLGFRGGAIAKIITYGRNQYEHKYKLPKLDDVRAYYDATELWIEDSYNKHSCGRSGIIGLPVRRIEKSGKNITEIITSGDYKEVTFFWDSKRSLLVTSQQKRDPIETKLKDMSWKDILKIEKRCFKIAIGGEFGFLNQANLTKVFKKYNNSVPRGMKPFFSVDRHFRL